MYICHNCGRIFEASRSTIDYDREITAGNISIYPVSPCCGEDFSEALQCKECGGWYAEQFVENGICAYCMAQAILKFKRMVSSNFSAEQIEFIDEQIESNSGLPGLLKTQKNETRFNL